MTDTFDRLNEALAGRYEIERELGEGGMAKVYLAKDLKHNRNVALKVLKPELAAVVGAERFLAEIETTANLQHPHILPLFDSGEADGFLFYVMPYVEGETLADRVKRERQLPVDEALGIATAVANALNAAHERGIVHRDIKPGNILLSSGQPLVADFGISIAVGAASGSRLTETGLSVGTPYYMSPEQATGDQAVGPASDTFALACVLYEMLVGEPPYPGATAQAVLGKIIQGAPVSATAIRKSIPANVDAAIRRALEKIPADRFTDARGFAKALADPAFRHGEDGQAAAADASGTNRRWRATAAVASLIAVGSLAALAVVATRSAPDPVTRSYLGFPEGEEPLTPLAGTFALSPDGSMLAYISGELGGAGESSIWIKERDALHARPLAGATGAFAPVFSPDGAELAFIQNGELKKMPVAGGASITLSDDVNTGLPGLAWLDDESIVFNATNWQLHRVPSSGGPIDTLIVHGEHDALDRGGMAWPSGLPGARGVLFGACSSGCASVGFYVLDLRSGEVSGLVEGAGRGFYAPTGHLVYVRGEDGAVFAAPFDLEALTLTGPAIPVLEGVGTWLGAGADITMSGSGDLVYLEGSSDSRSVSRSLMWVSPDGEEPVDTTWRGQFDGVALSPNGRTIAVGVVDADRTDIWLKTESAPPVRLTFGGQANVRPVWHPDGEVVGFISSRGGNNDLWMKRADLSDNAQLLLDLEDPIATATWSPDGEWVVARVSSGDLWAIRPGLDSVPTAIAAEPGAWEMGPAISPDGQWIAYNSDADGTHQVYVRPFPGAATGAQRQVSTEGARNPRWSADGTRIFYEIDGSDDIGVAQVTLEPTFAPGARSTFLTSTMGRFRTTPTHANYTPHPDGSRVLRVANASARDGERAGALVYVQNWISALAEQLGVNR
ncbi:MAG: protein kinase [Gemmatimonadales bacterium]|nr:MAG: protein kinase [Gemmatimonadales bacterium]